MYMIDGEQSMTSYMRAINYNNGGICMEGMESN